MSAVERFSTQVVPLQRRHLFWREVVAEAFPGMVAHVAEGIRADLARCALGPVGLARARSNRAHIDRIANRDGRNILFHLQKRGRLTIIHGGHLTTANAGDVVMTDDSRPYTVDVSDGNECLILQVPADLLGAPLLQHDWHGRLLRGGDPNLAFFDSMLRGLWDQRDMIEQIDDRMGGLLVDAAGILCTRHVDRANADVTMPQTPVEYALANLGDPALGTALICDATGLSSRAIQKAFLRLAATTPTAFITERRLASAAEMLAAGDDRRITDIAFDVGFSDAAFFSRCFRRRFGVTPREWRAGQRNAAQPRFA